MSRPPACCTWTEAGGSSTRFGSSDRATSAATTDRAYAARKPVSRLRTWTRGPGPSSSSNSGTRSSARLLPDGADIFDAHLHLGHDIDGMVGDYDAARGADGAATASPAPSCSASTSPTGIPASAPRTTARSRSPSASDGRLIPFVRLDLNESPIEEARALPRRRCARHQAASARAAVHGERRAARARLRARRGAPRADPDPRRPRPAADRRRAAGARRALPGGDADHRARRHRRPRGARALHGRSARASSSTRRPGARSTCSTSTARSRPSRSSTRATTPTGSSRRRC